MVFRMPPLSRSKLSSEVLYGLLISIFLAALSFIGTFTSAHFQEFYGLVQFLTLGVGCLHLWAGKRFAPALFISFGKGALATLLILLVAVGMALAAYWQTGDLAERWPFVTSLLPFLIPYLIGEAYHYYVQIPPASYRPWYYPLQGDMPDVDLLDLSKILVIQFEFLKTPSDANNTNFKAKAPVAMTLGDLFLIFINDYNERTPASPIQYVNANGQPNGWVFAKKTAWWQRSVYFDPDLDFNRNQLTDNATVIARRVS